jgi:hypothetical protein
MGIVLSGLKLSSLYHIYWNYLPGIVVNAKYISSIVWHFVFNTPTAYHTTLCSAQQYIIPRHVQHIRECHTIFCWTHLRYVYLFMPSISAGCDTSLCSTHEQIYIVLNTSAIYHTSSYSLYQQYIIPFHA